MPLNYKTRNQATAQGRPRVYFCCHPEDFGDCFDWLTDQILKTQDCAIWYAQGDGAEPEDLEQMQLFVMPVTWRLLRTENATLQVEFPFAVEHHIPVLPVMLDSGLEQLFNETCGDLQFLDPNVRDDTTLSFEEKLKKFLDSVLIGDELAGQIRAAFDAYVFLSYRKKDRRKAQELMRLIHRNDFCRDLAIWYDEFLVPGENFNDAIRAALEKSGLFVLAVTPNLVNELNYIMTTEYPMAIEADKPILPVEMEETDRQELEAKYEAIPPCTDGRDEAALSQALLDALHSLALRENDKDPQHNFFIGLAYLGGVDVEVDHDRALELIRDSAEAGLMAAAKKLVDMYTTGMGVKRDYLQAAAWQERVCEIAQAQYDAKPGTDTLSDLSWEIISCGDQYEALGKLAQAKGMYTRAMALLETAPEATERQKSVSYGRMGNILKAEGDLAEAKEYYLRGLAIDEALAEEAGTIQARRDLSVSYNLVGNILRAEGDLAGAKQYLLQSLAIAEALAEETGTTDVRRDLSLSYDNVGDILKAEGDLAEAKKYCQRSLALREALAGETGTIQDRRGLLVGCVKVGDLLTAEGDLVGAREYYLRSLATAEALAEETGTIQARRDLSVSCNNMGDILKAEGDLAGAKEFYLHGFAVAEALTEETGTIEARRDLSVSCNHVGDILQAEGDLTGAKEYYLRSLALREALAGETGTIEARRDLSISCDKAGNILKAEGDMAEAKRYFLRSLALREALAEETGAIQARRDLSVSYDNVGNILKAEGDLSGAKEYYLRSLAIAKAVAEKTGTIQARRDLSVSYNLVGNILRAEGDLAGAKQYLLHSLAIAEALAEETGTVESWDDLAVSYVKMYAIEPKGNHNFLEQAVGIYERLSRLCPGAVRYQKVLEMLRPYLYAAIKTYLLASG